MFKKLYNCIFPKEGKRLLWTDRMMEGAFVQQLGQHCRERCRNGMLERWHNIYKKKTHLTRTSELCRRIFIRPAWHPFHKIASNTLKQIWRYIVSITLCNYYSYRFTKNMFNYTPQISSRFTVFIVVPFICLKNVHLGSVRVR